MNFRPATAEDNVRGMRRAAWVRGAVVGAVIGGGVWMGWSWATRDELPDFSVFKNTKEKKAAFFNYLLPFIESVNGAILADRKRLLGIREELIDSDSAGFFDNRWLRAKAEEYGVEIPEVLSAPFADQVLRRVDIIAPSLVLAQTANESAWGTSRFARRGNNLFGMRTFDGSGLVPKQRGAGKRFTVAVYDSPRDSIQAYVDNLNTHARYRRLRQIRAGLRKRGQPVTGHALSNGLGAYSERGSEYISILQSMMRSNKLARFDQ